MFWAHGVLQHVAARVLVSTYRNFTIIAIVARFEKKIV